MAVGLICIAATSPGLAAVLSVGAEDAGQGASVPLAISFSSEGERVVGLQFELVFDGSALSLASVTGDAVRTSGKSLYVAPLASNRTRFLVWEFNQDPISDGTLVNLFVNIQAGATLGVSQIKLEAALASDADGNPLTLTTSDGSVTIQSAPGSALLTDGVLNGGSLLSGAVAPGEIVTIMGAGIGPPALAKASITFEGLSAPIIYAGSDQINAVVPFGIAGHSSVEMQVANSSGAPTTLVVPAASAAPAIFTLTGNGAGPGAILNQDSTVNSPDNPAERGSIIVLFATGAGQTDPPGADGTFPTTVLPKPLLPVSVTVGGASADILYAGAAPELISGVLQVNCRVPAQIDAGNAVPVVLRVGDAISPPVTVAVR